MLFAPKFRERAPHLRRANCGTRSLFWHKNPSVLCNFHWLQTAGEIFLCASNSSDSLQFLLWLYGWINNVYLESEPLICAEQTAGLAPSFGTKIPLFSAIFIGCKLRGRFSCVPRTHPILCNFRDVDDVAPKFRERAPHLRRANCGTRSFFWHKNPSALCNFPRLCRRGRPCPIVAQWWSGAAEVAG